MLWKRKGWLGRWSGHRCRAAAAAAAVRCRLPAQLALATLDVADNAGAAAVGTRARQECWAAALLVAAGTTGAPAVAC